ncbi:unnamed protein product [Arctogadus glacialis]
MVSVTVVDDAAVQPRVKGLSVGQAEAAGRGAPRSASVMASGDGARSASEWACVRELWDSSLGFGVHRYKTKQHKNLHSGS